jgi:beta-galactosidase
VAIRVTPDRSSIHADGTDLSYLLVEAIDKDGNLCPLASNRIDISLSGPGSIAGVGNGNPQSVDPFQATFVHLFYGKAMIILQSGKQKGEIRVTASSEGLKNETKILKAE